MGSKKEFITMNKKEADEEGGIKVKTEKRAKMPFLQKRKIYILAAAASTNFIDPHIWIVSHHFA